MSLEEPADVAEPLFAAATEMLRKRAGLAGRGVRLLGLSAQRLIAHNDTTETLFPNDRSDKNRKAAHAIDRLRERFGDSAVVFGRLLEGRQANTGTPSDEKPGD